MRLSNKLLGQGYVKERLKSSLRKFYDRYGDLTKQYEVPLSRMLYDILDDDNIQWHPPLRAHSTKFWPLLIWTLLPNVTFYLIVQGFHRTLTPPNTWSCPTLGLACVLMSGRICPELVLFPDFWVSNIPRYFSFAWRGNDRCYSNVLINLHNATAITTGSANQRSKPPCICLLVDVIFRGLENSHETCNLNM